MPAYLIIMWHSEADIISDLATLNDFGEPGDSEPYKILCSIGRGSKPKKKTQPKTLLNPRTGEEIQLDDHCLNIEEMLYRGKGRGAVLDARSYSLLHKQLRMARPLGSGDAIIESYCRRNKSPDQVEATTVVSNSQCTDIHKKSSDKACPTSSSKMKPRVKAMRNSNLLNNALMTSLLKAKETSLQNSEIEKSNETNEQKIINESNGVFCHGFKNHEIVKNGICWTDSDSDDSLSWPTSEDATTESLCISSRISNKQEISDKIIVMEDECSKIVHIDLNENFNAYLSFNEKENAVQSTFKKESPFRNTLYYSNNGQALDKSEIYRKLGEKINKAKVYGNQNNEDCFCMKSLGRVNKTLDAHKSDIESTTKQWQCAYYESNFPPLSKND